VDNPTAGYSADGRDWGGQYGSEHARDVIGPRMAAGDFDLDAAAGSTWYLGQVPAIP